ncbi:MAG: DUF3788 domain-containing protein [Firmicutes bacterium]|nr:DUF3788 domain-containing protein [Bacillota bacterium]
MEKIDRPLLTDPAVPPTDEIIAAGLGDANAAFIKFVAKLGTFGISLMDWRYYYDGKAWLSKGEYRWTTPRGTQKMRPLFWLSIWEGFFQVGFFFSESVRTELLGLELSQAAKELVQNAKPMGKTMRFLPLAFRIADAAQLNDVYIVAQFKNAIGK